MNYQPDQEFTCDLICIRHAKTTFNDGEDLFFSSHPQVDWTTAEQYPQFCNDVLFSPKHIDAHLSERGQKECLKAKQLLKNQQIDIVLVSPLYRALQTSLNLFGQRKIKIQVRTELTEAFRYSCDLSTPIQEKQKQFSTIDFSNMKSFGLHWYIQNLGEKNKNKFKKWAIQNINSNFDQQQRVILQMVASRQIYQSDYQLRARAFKIKQMIATYRQKYSKIAVISHYYTIRAILSQGFHQDGSLIKNIQIPNAFPYWISLAKLLKIK